MSQLAGPGPGPKPAEPLPKITAIEVVDFELKNLGDRIRRRASHLSADIGSIADASDNRLSTTGINAGEIHTLVADISEFQTLIRVRKNLVSVEAQQ